MHNAHASSALCTVHIAIIIARYSIICISYLENCVHAKVDNIEEKHELLIKYTRSGKTKFRNWTPKIENRKQTTPDIQIYLMKMHMELGQQMVNSERCHNVIKLAGSGFIKCEM